MTIDKITLNDLNIFHQGGGDSVFELINFTNTVPGRDQLQNMLQHPFNSIIHIEAIQETIQTVGTLGLPIGVTNGTLMIVEQFYQTAFSLIPRNPSKISAHTYKALHLAEYSLLKYSITHCADLILGMKRLIDQYEEIKIAEPLKKLIHNLQPLFKIPEIDLLIKSSGIKNYTLAKQIHIAHVLRYRCKHGMIELIDAFAKIDAWHSMYLAQKKLHLVLPVFTHQNEPSLKTSGLFHILVKDPVPYSFILNNQMGFMFLTSANMAGKSTFIKSVGIAVYLAHIGMGVPAQHLELTLFDGLLSNINVTDNILKGESYFYNEVQRVSYTIKKINDGKRWLLLIDELFKGTNVQDAMKCSLTVIEGLLKIKTSLFILSTHLYEIADQLRKHPNIIFRYFETTIENEKPVFHYQLREGVSTDRLGYLILKQSGVVDLLKNI